MVEVVFGEEIFKEEVTFEVEIIIIEWRGIGKNRRTWRQSRSRERDRVRRSRSPSSSRSRSRTSTNRDRIRFSNVESMTTLPMNVLIWFLIIQIGKVTVQGQYHCIWQIVIQDWIRSNI